MKELAKLLDIEEHEQKPVLLLLIHSFFIGSFLSYFFSVANGAFLRSFNAQWLPFAYIASGLTGYAISSVFSHLQKKITYRWLLLGVLLTLLALMAFFTISLMGNAGSWIAFVMFMWVGPFYSLIALQFWSMAMKMFDLRQAKRLFGLLGTGDVISSLIGFASVPAILSFFKNGEGEIILLFLGMAGLVFGIFFQLKIFSLFSSQLSTKKTGKTATEESMKEVLKNKYFRLIFLVTFCSVLGQYFVDYNFMSLSRANFAKSELTAFIGSFFAIIKMVEFIVKTFMAGRLLKQYGLLFGLLLLPFLILIFTGIATLLQLFGASASLIFVPLAMNKLFDRSLRKAIDDPSVKVMYQPLDPETKLSVQTQAEGKAKQIGIVVGGIILIAFNYIPSYSIFATTIVLLAVLLAWGYYAKEMYQEYRATIRAKLVGDTENQHRNSKFGIYFLQDLLQNDQEFVVITALELAEKIEPASLAAYWAKLIDHPSPSVRTKAIELIRQHHVIEYLPTLKRASAFEQDQRLKQALAQNITILENLTHLNASTIIEMARNPDWKKREKAAVWLSHFDHPQKLLFLRELAGDKHVSVATAAIQASSSVKSVELWSLMIDYLSMAGLGNVSIPALVAEGEALVPMLDIAFSKMEDKPLTLLKIVQICGRIGGEKSQAFLIDKITYPNREVQLLASEMLVLSVYRADDKNISMLKQKLLSECAHITWLLACYLDIKSSAIDLKYFIELLNKSYQETRIHIFRILALIYDADSIERIEQNIDKGTKDGVTLALEMIDILIEDDVKGIVAIIAENTPFNEKYVLLSTYYPQIRFNKIEDRLKNILYEDFSKVSRWLKATAIAQLMEITPDVLYQEVHALAFSKDFFLKEMALINIHQVAPALYQRYTLSEKKRDKIKYDRVTGHNRALTRIPSNYGEVSMMRQNAFLKTIPEELLVKLSEIAEQEAIPAGEQPSYKYRKGNNIHFVIQGSLMLTANHGTEMTISGGDVIGLIEDIDMETYKFTTHTDTTIFYLGKESFYAIAQVHFELVYAIYSYLSKDFVTTAALNEEDSFEENILVTANI